MLRESPVHPRVFFTMVNKLLQVDGACPARIMRKTAMLDFPFSKLNLSILVITYMVKT